MDDIITALADIKPHGSFYTKKTLPLEALSLAIENVGPLAFPLKEKDIQNCLSVATLAHFGFRDQTLLNQSIRDTWEISPSLIQMDEARWQAALTPILADIQSELGLPAAAQLTAQLHNFLIYEPGQFFNAHQDSEKCDGMVASLVVVLPSPHLGGELVIAHHGDKKRCQSSRFKLDALHCLAFYADCHHQVKPVMSGYRVTLTYNLILNATQPTDFPTTQMTAPAHLLQSLQDYFCEPGDVVQMGDLPSKYVYLLDHQYTPKGLSWSHLKNVDRLRAAALQQSAAALDLEIYLTLVDIQEVWLCAEEGDGHDFDRLSSCRLELIELLENGTHLSHWLDDNNHPVDYPQAIVADDEMGWTKSTDAFKPFESEYEGWMGNYGNTLERWYHRAAIVLWRRADHYSMRFTMGPEQVIHEWIQAAETGSPVLSVSQVVSSVLPYWWVLQRSHHHTASLVDALLQLALHVQDATLARQMLQVLTLHILTPETAVWCYQLARAYGAPWCLSLFEAWETPKNHRDTPWVCDALLEVVNHLLGDNPAHHALIHWLLVHQWQVLEKQHADAWKYHTRVQWLSGSLERLQALKTLLQACQMTRHESVAMVVVDHLMVHAARYPALDVMQVWSEIDDPELLVYDFWLLHLLSELQAEYALGLRAADDWSIEAVSCCDCADCQTLNTFLRSRVDTQTIWPLAQARRAHIHRAIDGLGIPVMHDTRRTGSPHKLVLTKTRALHDDAAQRFAQLKQALSRLEALYRACAN